MEKKTEKNGENWRKLEKNGKIWRNCSFFLNFAILLNCSSFLITSLGFRNVRLKDSERDGLS